MWIEAALEDVICKMSSACGSIVGAGTEAAGLRASVYIVRVFVVVDDGSSVTVG